jgi:hypothetical protein
MTDNRTFTLHRADQARTDFAAIESDLEFIVEQLARLPTRKEMALRPLYVVFGSAAIVILWIELFRHACL